MKLDFKRCRELGGGLPVGLPGFQFELRTRRPAELIPLNGKALDEQIQSEKQKLGPLAHAAQQCIIAATDNTKARNSVATAVSFARDYAPNLMAPHIAYVGEHSEECRNKLKAVQAQSRRIVELMREREAIV